ncbi:hypothetical protein TUA1478L_03310 [Lactiplantibacillus plantarum]
MQGHEDLNYPKYHAYYPAKYRERSIFDLIKDHDILMQYPYDDFKPVVDFIHEAAEDEDVLAIKMTLYRVSADSPIIKYLGQAAQNGKQVTVLVEVKARFDEENNVHWAKKLEEMGCHVIYGLIGLKTHCKLALVVRRENEGIKRYMHMGTGNYNDVTAHFYTDMGSSPLIQTWESMLPTSLTCYLAILNHRISTNCTSHQMASATLSTKS